MPFMCISSPLSISLSYRCRIWADLSNMIVLCLHFECSPLTTLQVSPWERSTKWKYPGFMSMDHMRYQKLTQSFVLAKFFFRLLCWSNQSVNVKVINWKGTIPLEGLFAIYKLGNATTWSFMNVCTLQYLHRASYHTSYFYDPSFWKASWILSMWIMSCRKISDVPNCFCFVISLADFIKPFEADYLSWFGS